MKDSNHNYPKLASASTCTACMTCIDSCNHGAISYYVDKLGFFKIKIDSEKCISCGLCSKRCPIINKKPVEKNSYLECFSAWCNDEALRSRSASGGVFAAVAMEVLQRGGVVYGASIDGLDIRHIRINQTSDLYKLQGSKYQPSILTGMYKSVRADLKSGLLVLFSGLGCQIAGLYSFLGNITYENLITIDTICGGVASMLPMINLRNKKKYSSILSFRDKDNGWKSRGFEYSLKMQTTKGSIEKLPANNMVLRTFSSKIGKRASCLNCSFSGIHRQSDCTIGDFWGIDINTKEEEKGVSALLVHSSRFMDLLKASNVTINSVNWHDIALNNPCLYFSKSPAIQYFISRKFFLRALLKENYKHAAMILDNPILSIESKIYNRFITKKKQIFLKKYIK